MIYGSGENWCQWRPAAESPEPGRRGSVAAVPWKPMGLPLYFTYNKSHTPYRATPDNDDHQTTAEITDCFLHSVG